MNFKQKATLALAVIALTASNLVAAQTTTLLNVSYDVAREFYKEIEFQVLTLTDPSTVTSTMSLWVT